ncbi:MAG: hypothetical protein ABI548_06190 [Polyangiaceae bacterium]
MLAHCVENTGPAQIVVFAWGRERMPALQDKRARLKAGDTVFPRLEPARITLFAARSMNAVAPQLAAIIGRNADELF